MLPPKTSHYAKFHRDRSNQLGEKRYLFGPSRHFFCHGQKRDYLSRVSQRARGATKNEVILPQCFATNRSGIGHLIYKNKWRKKTDGELANIGSCGILKSSLSVEPRNNGWDWFPGYGANRSGNQDVCFTMMYNQGLVSQH